MSKLTPNLGLHIWEIPEDNEEKFNYKKSVGDNFEKIDKSYKEAVDKFTEPLSYKGEVEKYENLPNENNKNGDIYNVTSENKNYIWNGTEWVEYSSTLDLTYLEDNTRVLQTTEPAEELEINNCAEANGKLDIVSGKSWQETRSGKNLANIPDVQVSGTSIKSYKIENIKENTEYTLSITKSRIEGVPITNNSFWMIGRISFFNNDSLLNKMDGDTATLTTGSIRKSYTFTTPQSCNKIEITVSNSNGDANINILVSKIQLELGPVATDYEPYGAMPSPEFPSEIRNVGDNINLFDKNSSTGNGFYDTTGKQQNAGTWNLFEFIPKLNTYYTLSIKNFSRKRHCIFCR